MKIKIKTLMTAVMSLFLVFTLSMNAAGAARTVTAHTDINKAPVVKVGKNTITAESTNDSSIFAMVRFTASKDGTYTFKVSKLQSSEIKYPRLDMGVQKCDTFSEYLLDYENVPVMLNGQSQLMAQCVSTKWYNSVKNDAILQTAKDMGCVTKWNTTLTLKKGNTLIFYMDRPMSMETDSSKGKTASGSIKFNLNIERKD